MVDVSVSGGTVALHVRGSDRLWPLKSSLEIPLQHIAGIRPDREHGRGIGSGRYAGIAENLRNLVVIFFSNKRVETRLRLEQERVERPLHTVVRMKVKIGT